MSSGITNDKAKQTIKSTSDISPEDCKPMQPDNPGNLARDTRAKRARVSTTTRVCVCVCVRVDEMVGELPGGVVVGQCLHGLVHLGEGGTAAGSHWVHRWDSLMRGAARKVLRGPSARHCSRYPKLYTSLAGMTLSPGRTSGAIQAASSRKSWSEQALVLCFIPFVCVCVCVCV